MSLKLYATGKTLPKKIYVDKFIDEYNGAVVQPGSRLVVRATVLMKKRNPEINRLEKPRDRSSNACRGGSALLHPSELPHSTPERVKLGYAENLRRLINIYSIVLKSNSAIKVEDD